jgi:hypothetical protein
MYLIDNKINGNSISDISYMEKGLQKVTLEDGSAFIIPIRIIETRREAIVEAEILTKSLLKNDSAFYFFHKLTNDFTRFRNYEIESYLTECSLWAVSYIIRETCPFNGYSSILK